VDEKMTKQIVSLEVKNFEKEMQRIEKEVAYLAKNEIKTLVEYATEQLRLVTPVDTGRARQGWANEMKLTPDELELVEALIFNEVPYINKLNQGHSQQAPRYFIEQVLLKIGILTPE